MNLYERSERVYGKANGVLMEADLNKKQIICRRDQIDVFRDHQNVVLINRRAVILMDGPEEVLTKD